MSRTIRLTRIHALNWYGYKDSIPVEGNLLLAGVTGSGKSILMDLVQLVLIGDQRLVRFNQSATGDRSDRSLKGYCLGDLKDDEGGVDKYMRPSAITYVGLEFSWPTGKRVETWGLRIEFTSTAETHGKVTPFLIPAALARSDFLHPDKRPLDYPAFKALVESHQGRLYTEGLDAYLRDMAQPTHLNFDRAVLRALLPTAMSFTFLKSFNDFARNFILPADKLDVSDVTASYRTFLGYERDLAALSDQYKRLKAIHATFTRLAELGRDLALSRHLEAQLRWEHGAELLAEEECQKTKLEKDCATEDARLRELEDLIPGLRRQIDSYKSAINETPEGRLYAELKSRNEILVRQMSQLTAIGATVEQALGHRLRRAREWLKEMRGVPLELESVPVDALESAILAAEQGGVSKANATLTALKAAADLALAAIHRAAGPAQKRLADIRLQLGQLRDEIAALKVGKLPFPTRLLDALNDSLPARGSNLPARHLRELCEVADERWRPAIEVAFARKFAVVVAAEDYDQAERIYHQLKPSQLGVESSHESLVNPVKALQRRRPVRPGSLAEKLKTDHPVAEAIISEAFGHLICVERREQLREHDFAILPDGFMSRGAFIERPRFYDGNPFVGQKGLEQQRVWKEKLAADLESEERRFLPAERAVKSLTDGWRDQFEVPASLIQDLMRAQELPGIQVELENNISKLNRIDRSKFDELAQEQVQLEANLKILEEEQRHLDRSEKRARLRDLKVSIEKMGEMVHKLRENFEKIRNESDISPWLKQKERWGSLMLEKFPAKEVAASRFGQLLNRLENRKTGAWERLKAKRRELAKDHPKFDHLPIEEAGNEAHDKQLARLEESDIPEYRAKAERELKNWERLFRAQILEKLHNALREVENLIMLLNSSLRKRPIGANTYELRYRRNPDYQLYHELLEASAVAREDDLFFASASQRFRDAIDHFLKTLTEAPDGSEAARLLDYRHYYEYDMEVVEADGRKTSVDRHSGKFSGGENQSPYFIAILASYLRAYRRYSSRRADPSLGLVPIDEAFSKLSGERIKDCISAIKAFDLQGLFSMSTGNIPYAFEHCDWLVVVSKEERRLGKRSEIRNIPVSLARESEDARRLMTQ